MPIQVTENNFFQKEAAQKISNVLQVGGIETAVIDNGAGRGTRIAWVNTGSGLRYKVVIDRAMDIADAFFNQHSLAWISSKGIAAPQPFSDKGADWLRNFGGGLLTTCGLSHIGGAEKDEYGERGVHGMISNCAAEIESIIQPDPWKGSLEMSITGVIRETKIFGPSLMLRRRISSTLGDAAIRIQDEITNCGNETVPHMLLYHFNFGWPLVDKGAELMWNGITNFTCPPPLDKHRGGNEDVFIVDLQPDENDKCMCAVQNNNLNIRAEIKFNKKELPYFTNWQHWAPGEYVTGLEPGTNPPIGQAAARKENKLIFLEPRETRTYDVRLAIVNPIK
jgi:hypothetical protein